MEVMKVYKESLPNVKLIGKKYTQADRDAAGTFADYWQQCFREGWFDTLSQCASIPAISGDYLGAMRMTDEFNGFEYWIGALYAPEADVPPGFDAAQIAAGEIGVCWLYGNDKNGELFGVDACELYMRVFKEKGWKSSPDDWVFERYNNPRFTEPDEKGNVILDICAYLLAE